MRLGVTEYLSFVQVLERRNSILVEDFNVLAKLEFSHNNFRLLFFYLAVSYFYLIIIC